MMFSLQMHGAFPTALVLYNPIREKDHSARGRLKEHTFTGVQVGGDPQIQPFLSFGV